MTALVLGFLLIWTLYGTIADMGKSLDGDVVEAYVWGREFQFGYNQHPPLWAWISGLWFLIFPNMNWAFHLLAVVNSAVGLVGCWRLLGLFATGWTRLGSFTLLLLTPFYTFLCYKYNANSIFLSIWPWTLYFLVASLNKRRVVDAVWLGVLLGAAMLSKYYAITLVLTSLAASAVHPDRRAYFRSARPYISMVVCALLVMPHLVWLLHTNAPPVAYIWGRSGLGLLAASRYAAELLAAVVLYHSVPLMVLVAANPNGWRVARMWHRNQLLVILTCAPVVLTVLFGLVFELKISANMMIGAFPLAPLLMVEAISSANRQCIFLISKWLAASIAAACLLVSPAIAFVTATGSDPASTQPRQELAVVATALWHKQMGTRLLMVGGSDPYENAVGFYSPDRPTVFIGLSSAKAPWAAPGVRRRDGLLVICLRGDIVCSTLSKSFLSPQAKQFSVTCRHQALWQQGEAKTFDLILIAPLKS